MGMIGLAVMLVSAAGLALARDGFDGTKAGDERTIAGVKLCWCPPGKFTMGSPPGEPERRPGEDQVEVTLTRGFWIGKYEVTQGDWKRVVGKLPGELTAELPEGDDYPVGNVNFAEAEAFCRKLTELARKSGELPEGWEFRLPTEAQWEYACRAGTTTATAFGDTLSSKQANFKGKPYNGGPSRGRRWARRPGSAATRPTPGACTTCTATPSSGAGTGTTRSCPAASIPDLHRRAGDRDQEPGRRPSRGSRRGGAWTDDGWPCRSAFRLRFEPERRYDHIGFRVVAVRR